MTRKEANMEILRQLKHYLTMNPDQRFGQALRNMGIVVDRLNPETHQNEWINGFNEEPTATLKRVLEEKSKSNSEGGTNG